MWGPSVPQKVVDERLSSIVSVLVSTTHKALILHCVCILRNQVLTQINTQTQTEGIDISL